MNLSAVAVSEPENTPPLLRSQFQAKPCRYARLVAPIIERIDSGCASNPMRVLICLTAPYASLTRFWR